VVRGNDRIATTNLLNSQVKDVKGSFIVGYNALADAVSCASWAVANGYIIQIANPDGSFSGDTSLGGYILGGTGLVQDISGYTRIYGSDRYATNLRLRQTLIFDNDCLYVANGQTLVDALTGAVLAGRTNSPVVLVPDGASAESIDLGDVTEDTVVNIFGG
jgi:hypothetical protein